VLLGCVAAHAGRPVRKYGRGRAGGKPGLARGGGGERDIRVLVLNRDVVRGDG